MPALHQPQGCLVTPAHRENASIAAQCPIQVYPPQDVLDSHTIISTPLPQLVMPLPRVDDPAPLLPVNPTTRAFDKLLHVLAYLCHTIDTIATEVCHHFTPPQHSATHRNYLSLSHTYKVERRHLPMLACLGRVAGPTHNAQDDPPSLVLEHHVASVRHGPKKT